MKKALVVALLIIAAIPLLIGVAELPPHGDPDTPVHTHISAYYLENGVEEAGTENIVTAVILNYRGLDTSGEVDRHLHGARGRDGSARCRLALVRQKRPMPGAAHGARA